MKILISLLFLITLSLEINAQDNVFVLVDVSKSVKQTELLQAKQLVKDILLGSPANASIFTINGVLPSFSIIAGSKLMIMPFGDKSTVMNYVPMINLVSNHTDLINFIEQYFPITPIDNWTYISLTKARLAEIAKKKQVNEYKLIFISDNISDDFGGRPYYSLYEQQLVDGYNTQSNPVIEQPGTRIKLNSNNAFSIFVQKIDVSNYNPPQSNSSQIIDSVDISLKIELTSFKGGTNPKPFVINNSKITVSWFCKNAPSSAQYKIRVSPINKSGEKTQIFTTASNSYNLQNISDGKWKITISPGNFNASSASTTIEIETSGSTWLLWLLIFAAIVGGGYWYWKKLQNDKLKKLNSISDSDNISKGTTLNTNSDNSGYF